MKRCKRVAVVLPVAAGLCLVYAPVAVADADASIVSAEVSGTLTPGARASVKVVVMNHKAPAGQKSCISAKMDGGGGTSCFDLGAPGTSVTHDGFMEVLKDAKPGPRTVTVNLLPRAVGGLGKDTKTVTATVGNAPPACDPVSLNRDAFQLGHTEGLKDGREDGFADSYRQSYDDAFKKKPGLTAEQCQDFALSAFQNGYGKGYETGFKEGQAKGGKVGEKEGKEDRQKGNTSRNVTIRQLRVTALPATGEADCAQGVKFTASFLGSGTGTIQFHWERSSGKVPGTIEFSGGDAEPKTVTDQAAVPAGATTATLTQKFVIDSGPSKGKTAQATANVTCKK
ncbi:hypothetical protein [Streptomyces sp. NBC_00091]|uniref:hypothetical protein n=1 Tax=Streptomyces sp. NBC_00091 TaxID=2975648 RepID=UPI002254C013|nr:hypothetical protein [Streptomyces sp. NBC_00091]MCX5375962.1 hypothetical protein [Streptomyces sp. NBC_00091]